LHNGETAALRRPDLVLWCAVAAVLLIGCVNTAGLLMARGVTRAPEIAMRMALGGGRAAILRQLLTESVLLTAIGGAAGIALGYASVPAFAWLLQDAFGIPPTDIALDARVLTITAVVALATSIVFGLVPALQACRVDLRAT